MPLLQTIGNQPEHYQDAHLFLDFQRKTVSLDLERLRLHTEGIRTARHAGPKRRRYRRRGKICCSISGVTAPRSVPALSTSISAASGRKLAEHAELYIETIFGIGYRFQPYRAHALPRPLAPAYAVGA